MKVAYITESDNTKTQYTITDKELQVFPDNCNKCHYIKATDLVKLVKLQCDNCLDSDCPNWKGSSAESKTISNLEGWNSVLEHDIIEQRERICKLKRLLCLVTAVTVIAVPTLLLLLLL